MRYSSGSPSRSELFSCSPLIERTAAGQQGSVPLAKVQVSTCSSGAGTSSARASLGLAVQDANALMLCCACVSGAQLQAHTVSFFRSPVYHSICPLRQVYNIATCMQICIVTQTLCRSAAQELHHGCCRIGMSKSTGIHVSTLL